MGYSHYYSYNLSSPQFDRLWPKIVEDAGRIVARVQSAGIRLCNPLEGNPHFAGVEFVALNGTIEGVESLIIFRDVPATYWTQPRNGSLSGIVKTGRQPYDLAVTAVLLRCQMLLPHVFAIASDGAWDEEWLYGATGPMPGGLGARTVVAELFGNAPTTSPFDHKRALLL
ncbi:hypothetical protein GCM10023176_54920 [Micromonospora coerulea]|uniref:Uncharacterized protein n=1 Tax=Micromonospora coerulea TaxID=47856 RepID=A0ABP8T2U3_9ACTN